MRRILFLLALAATGCGRDDPQPPPSQPAAAGSPAASHAPPPTAVPVATADEAEAGAGAVAVLRRYYDHLEAGRYRDAWAMRGGDEEGLERFAANFAAYERYRVTLGHATRPVAAGGWTYVEVPIQILGTLKGGKGFGSVGSVTMRRATGAAGAGPRERDWHIYTG